MIWSHSSPFIITYNLLYDDNKNTQILAVFHEIGGPEIWDRK